MKHIPALAACIGVANVIACTEFSFEHRAPAIGAGAGGGTSRGGSAGVTSGTGGRAGATGNAGQGGSGGTPDFTQLALTPPMGWNSWNKFSGGVNETVIRQIADAMLSSGMKDVGYEYVNVDDTWQAMERDAAGNIQADPGRFPSGMQALADYIHERGLKFGLYSDRGTKTCAGRPGSFGYEVQDAELYAAWGVDYLKHDNCYIPPERNTDQAMREDYTLMGDALRATGRPIVYSICAWWFYDWMPGVGHLWRTTTDIRDGWSDNLLVLLNRNGGYAPRYDDAVYSEPGIAEHAGPGGWNDPDMLEVGNGGMTDIEYRSHFSLWAIMAAPLIAGNDLRSMSPATREILTNAEVIAVDQDALGKQGKPISASTTLEVWSKPLVDGSYAVVLFNRTEAAADIPLPFASLGLTSPNAALRDLWAHTDLGSFNAQYVASAVPSHGVVMLKVTAIP